MKYLYIFIIAVSASLMWGCSDDLLQGAGKSDDAELPSVEAFLSLSVNDFNVTTDGSRAAEPSETPEPVSDEENRIDDLWVFQYDASGSRIIKPTYLRISANGDGKIEDKNGIFTSAQNDVARLKVNLALGQSKICVVANTGDENWGKGTELQTLEGLKNKALSNPEPILLSEFRSIPMEGVSENVVVKQGSVVSVPVTRMYAKLRISFGKLVKGMSPKSIEINNIPNYCRVNTLGEGIDESTPASYAAGTDWVTRAFNAENTPDDETDPTEKEYVIYIPENLQGEISNQGDKDKNEVAPENALVINLVTKYNYEEPVPGSGYTKLNLQEDRHYSVCPGGNTTNNFNIKRNHVYRVNVNVYDPVQYTPSSNCFVVIPSNNIAFEPYYRTETGGGYNFADYLNPEDPAKKIVRVGIIWQTKESIGDNSNGDKVWFALNSDNPLHSRIIVSTQKEGNALIGGYNQNNEIVWSWHIWITDNDPGNVGNAIVYDTYDWDNNGIKTNNRVPGYAVMPCNLGALANTPEDIGDENTPDSWYSKNYRTYGNLYQWGRKDPFPPAKKKTKLIGLYYYNDSANGANSTDGLGSNIEVYDNSHTRIVMKSNGLVSSDKVFNTILATNTELGSTSQSGIVYSIKHPTIHIAGARSSDYSAANSYINRGDWLPQEDEKLWGAIPKAGTDRLVIITGESSIYRNYGPLKTIFDPCPQGWRVPPGDLWMGFTKDGKNQSGGTESTSNEDLWSTCNVSRKYDKKYYNANNGYWFCLNGWQSEEQSKYSFFPTQGARLASGQPLHGGCCGNYHNATSDAPWNKLDYYSHYIDRVNILHIHTFSNQFTIYPFENSLAYSTKAVAGPVRCVRDTK